MKRHDVFETSAMNKITAMDTKMKGVTTNIDGIKLDISDAKEVTKNLRSELNKKIDNVAHDIGGNFKFMRLKNNNILTQIMNLFDTFTSPDSTT